MSITIPSGTVNYGTLGQNLNPQICWWRGQPAVDLAIPCEIDWGNSGGTGVVAPAVELNIAAQLTNQNFGILQTLVVNNNESSVDVSFLFPDTQFKLDVPAGGSGVFQVLSISAHFYIAAPGAGAADKTFFTCLNFAAQPVAIEKNYFPTAASIAVGSLNAGVTALVAPGVNGTLEGLTVVVQAANGANYIGTITVADGNGQTIYVGDCTSAVGTGVTSVVLINQSGINLRFQNGINITVQVTLGAPPPGVLNVTGFYH